MQAIYDSIRSLNCCISAKDDTHRAEENTDKADNKEKTPGNSASEAAVTTKPPVPSNNATNSSDNSRNINSNHGRDAIKNVADKNQKKLQRPPSITPPPITRMFLVQPHVTPDQKWAAEETIYKVYSSPYRFPLWSSMTLDEQVYFTVAKEENIRESMGLDDNYLLNKVIYLHDTQVKACRWP
ncbi:hypothetical protein LPJ53_002943 [Coemansia erecta]|uniref:Uncharacterized protein n=1 Tax=Coemansia erecta TaxID=147472 RepID=A0A9W7XX69_9FUNG|nr:hypothetical protein LPJ53_002943 [Coemansia erecta]